MPRLLGPSGILVIVAGAAAYLCAACGSSSSAGHETGVDGGGAPGDAAGGRDAPSSTDGATKQDGGSPPGSEAGPALEAGPTMASDSGTIGMAGNPSGSCSMGIPSKGMPADTSNATVVGKGTAASCTFDALSAAVGAGGAVTFNCGSDAVTIPVTATITVPYDKNTVIDGGNKVTLDGGGAVQILNFNSPNFQANDFGLTLQHIALVNGKATPTQAIPPAPAPCSQGWDDGQGGALYMRDGNLTVIDCIFTGNQAAPLGPDTGGGAIYVLGSKNGALIVSSTFENNQASNAGAVGGLFAELDVYDSLFDSNAAIGHDANDNDPSECSAMNAGQNEVGSGGNGGALYSDGNSVNVLLCGDQITNNAAGVNAFGGGLFFTSDNMEGTLTIIDTTMTGNTGGSWTNVSTGSVTDVGSAIGVNAASITVTSSTLQGT